MSCRPTYVLVLALASWSTCCTRPRQLKTNQILRVEVGTREYLGHSVARVNATITAKRTIEARLAGGCNVLDVHKCHASERKGPPWPCICDIEVWKVVLGLVTPCTLIGASILAAFVQLTKQPVIETQTEEGPNHLDDMTRRLAEVKMQGHRQRLKVSGPLALLGLTLISFALPITYFYQKAKIVFVVFVTLRVLLAGFTILVAALLPTDTKTILAVSSVALILLIVNGYTLGSLAFLVHTEKRSLLKANGASDFMINYRVGIISTDAVLEILLGLSTLGHMCLSPFSKLLHHLWNVAGWLSLFWLLATLPVIAGKLTGLPAFHRWPWSCILPALGFSSLNAVFCLDPTSRHRIRHWLTSQSEESAAASGVAELISHKDPAETLKHAAATFLCVPMDRLTREDMADNKPNPRLRVHAQSATLGSVDAFMSHSWHDDAEQKWTALQAWREEFKQEHEGREPTLWIDKYCIDQTNIEDSLACLPIYLAGCKKLSVFCGKTYLERLWCVVELFVFMEMNLDIEHFEVRMLGVDEDVRVLIEDFDVKNARCFTEEDTRRLQIVIDAGGPGLTQQLIAFVKEHFKENASTG